MFGRKARIPVDILCGTSLSDNMKVDDYMAQQCRILEEAYRQVYHTVGLKQDRQKELYDCRRHGESFQNGNFVLHSSVVPQGRSKKMHCPWNGPYRVLKKLSEVTY